jgi:hypothetical protein
VLTFEEPFKHGAFLSIERRVLNIDLSFVLNDTEIAAASLLCVYSSKLLMYGID